ncbi:MAG: AAA family ATPase [Clostridium sp.]|uniref:AAA family ATPase n=1 Tax=Clostridium sp. TaxID=1506 RepID=UPI002A91FCEC|nr:AAA family ATPase [Clostridium sp.]MDY6228045.1 AAA family ATPase [Clostridium sp.]
MKDTKEKIKEELKIRDIDIISILYDRFKEKTVEYIKENPYELGHFINIDINAVKGIIKNLYPKDERINLIAFYIIFILEMNKSNNGHVFVYENDLFNDCNERIKGVSDSEFKKSLSLLENKKAIVIDESYIYLQELYQAEVSLSEMIAEKSNKKTGINKREAELFVDSYVDFQLNKEQKQAVLMALTNKISIISGNAGTGKTTVIRAIVDGFKKFMDNNDIKLVSLSGKAVRRIEESTNLKAYTIHSLLNDKKKISADILFIDEASMVGLQLFEKLLSALKRDCIIVITGDVKQLSSIESGQVFNDLIQSGIIKNTKLTQIVRQTNDNIIIENANKIGEGKGIEKGGVKLKKGQFEFYECESKEINTKVVERIISLLNDKHSIYDIQVIAPQKQNNGTIELNRSIGEAFNKPVVSELKRKDIDFVVLDPVIQNINNYKRGIFNGQKGSISGMKNKNDGNIDELTVTFDNDRDVVYKDEEINELELAYALTVHKMQGSEEKTIIFTVSPKHKNLNRNLIYTAVTRAVERVIVVGDKETFNNAVAKENRVRNSNLINRLQEVHCTTV